MQNSKQAWPSAGRTDSFKSTFKHLIHLNNDKKTVLYGYSKPLLNMEGPDKILVLERELMRLFKRGYVFGKTEKYGHTTHKMEVFLCGNYTGDPDIPIMTLYPDEYTLDSDYYLTDKRLNAFLTRVYEQFLSGKILTHELIHKNVVVNRDNEFDIHKKRFNSEPELYRWMQKKLKEDNARDLVLNFYYKYRQKWF